MMRPIAPSSSTPAAPTTRLWAGPLMLIIIIALIYLLSLMPTAPPHLTSSGLISHEIPPHTTEYAMKGQIHVNWEASPSSYRQRHPIPDDPKSDYPHCLNGGISNDSNGTCICTRWFSGDRCEIPICLNGGIYNQTLGRCQCFGVWVGEHCIFRCTAGYVNSTTGTCDCEDNKPCKIYKCVNGQFYDGQCVCYDGFTGPSCTICESPSSCDEIVRKRGSVNSRLTLSGLSFCIITIGLLCVGARRKRVMSANTASIPFSGGETWYRMFHPETAQRPFRCRHDYVCGGSWIPRDRALIVAPGRVTVTTQNPSSSARIHRIVTPPPSYTSVDNLSPTANNNSTDQQQPPTYEEATRGYTPANEDTTVAADETSDADTTKDEQQSVDIAIDIE